MILQISEKSYLSLVLGKGVVAISVWHCIRCFTQSFCSTEGGWEIGIYSFQSLIIQTTNIAALRLNNKTSGPWLNIKMTSYQYRKSHCGDKTILRPSYLHNGISYTGKMASLYWFSPLITYWPWPQVQVQQPVYRGLQYREHSILILHITSTASQLSTTVASILTRQIWGIW